LCDVTAYFLVEVHRSFGGTHCFHSQSRRVNTVSKQAARTVSPCFFLICFLSSLFDPEGGLGASLRNICKHLPDYMASLAENSTLPNNFSKNLKPQNIKVAPALKDRAKKSHKGMGIRDHVLLISAPGGPT
jgi:hypothetical protein